MKRLRKIIIGVMSLVMVGTSGMPVMAADNMIEAQLKGSNVTYKAGEKAALTLTIKNTGDNNLTNVVLQPLYSSSTAEWPFKEVDNAAHKKTISELKAGTSTDVEYSFTTRDDVSSGRCRISFSISGVKEQPIEFTVFPFTQEAEKKKEVQKVEIVNGGNNGSNTADSGGGEISAASYDGGGVYNEETSGGGETSTDGSVPRVIVTGFTTEPGNVKAGSDFKLIVHLKNTSKKTAVSNMVVDFSAPTEGTDESTSAPAFLPTSGSNTIYVEKIAANGTKDVTIEMNAKADLVQKPYSLNITMKYEDKSAAQFESESSISVPIKQDARFEFSEFEISPESISVGGEANVMCNMYNLGRIKLYNVKASFEGQGISASEIFVGNVEPGATASIDGMISGSEATAGDGRVKMILTYEDEGGNVSTVEEEFTLMVTEEMTEEMLMDEGEMIEESSGFPVWLIVVIAVVVVAAAAIAFIIIRKKKKTREGDGMEDELDRLIEDEHGES